MIGKREVKKTIIGMAGIGILSLALIGWTPSTLGNDPGQSPEVQDEPSQEIQKGPAGQEETGKVDESTTPEEMNPLESYPSQGQYAENHFLSTGELIGFEVRSQEGDAVGKIYDVLLDGERKKAPLVVVSFGGLFGIGDDLYAIPWQQFRHDPNSHTCVLSVPKAPETVAEARTDWIALEETFSEDEPKFAQGPYGLKKTDEAAERIPAAHEWSSSLVSANEMFGKSVRRGGSEDELGNLESLVLGSGGGHLVCAILSIPMEPENLTPPQVGGPIVGEPSLSKDTLTEYKRVAVPMTLIELDAMKKTFSANVSTPEIHNAPDFGEVRKGETKGLDREWCESVFDQFGEDLNRIGEDERIQAESVAL